MSTKITSQLKTHSGMLRRDSNKHKNDISRLKRVACAFAISSALSIIAIPNSSAFTIKENNVTLYELIGESVQNSINDSTSIATGVEESKAINNNIGWTFGYLDEGTKNNENRSGIFGDLMFINNNSEYVKSFIGIGPYLTTTLSFPPLEKSGYSHLNLNVLFGIDAKITENISVIAEWMQTKTFDNEDTDIIMGGIGVKFPNKNGGTGGLFSDDQNRSATYIMRGKSSYDYSTSPAWELIQTITPKGSNNTLAVGYLNEGHKYAQDNSIDKRDGLFVEWWHNFPITKYASVFSSIGPYVSSTTDVTGVEYMVTKSTYINKYDINLIAGVGLIVKLPYKFNLITTLQYVYGDRYFEGHSTNSKIFSIGLGYRY